MSRLPVLNLAPAKSGGASVQNRLPQSAGKRRDITPVKWLMDKVFAVIALLLLSPIFGLVAFLIWRTKSGPVFFAHPRVGMGGETFNCLKFRTMHPDAPAMLVDILESDPIARQEWEASCKLEHDPRITRLGRLLRATSLDELPQFLNVLRGEMSLVGPRPVTASEARHYGDHFAIVTSVRPGVTGLWQVSGRSDISYEGRVALDLSYVQSGTIWHDLKILLRTFRCVVQRSGAY